MQSKSIVIGCVALTMVVIVIAILFYPFIKRVQYENKEREKMPISFFIQFPLIVDDMNYFKIPCTIGGDTLVLIVDTKAQSLMKEENIEKYAGEYFGKLPIPMENAYKTKEEIRMYYFDDFRIQEHRFGSPIFQIIGRDNLIYDLLGDGVLGINILSLCHWKFSVDERVVSLYSRKDSATMDSEINGYTQIPYGLHEQMIRLAFSGLHQSQDFTLDLGFNGEIEINNALADSLMRTVPFKTIETLRSDGSIGIVHLFEHQKVIWNEFVLTDCQLVNIPDVNGNYIGAELMSRFNFVLGFGDYVDHKKQDHLYIQPIQGFDTRQSKPFLSKFGFNIKSNGGSVIISAIERGGAGEKQGLRLGDQLVSIDRDAYDMVAANTAQFIAYAADKDSFVVRTPNSIYVLSK